MKVGYTKLISKGKQALSTATLKDTTVVFVGNGVSAVLGAVFFFMLAHQGGAVTFGIFSVVIAVATTAVDLFDIAINNSIINYAADQDQRGAVLRFGLQQKFILSAVTVAGLWLSAPLVVGLLGQPELISSLRMAIWLIPARAVFSFIKTSLQVATQFHLDAFIEVASSGLRLVGFLLLRSAHLEILWAALAAYVGSLVLGSLFGLPGVHRLLVGDSDRLDTGGFTRFQRWMTLSFIASTISSRLDVFFLTRLTSLEVVGWYQAAVRLFMPAQQLASALSRVFAPRFSNFVTNLEASHYLRKSLMLSGTLTATLLLTIPLFRIVIPILYGKEFAFSVILSYQLLPYFMLFLLSTPWWTLLLYYQKDARRFALLSGVQLLLLVVSLPVAIGAFGVTGAAVALFVSLVATTTAVVKFELA